MSALQWALLLLGAGVIVMLILLRRREKRMLQPFLRSSDSHLSRMRVVQDAYQPPVSTGGGRASGAEFDQFGVGKPRKRGADTPRIEPALTSNPAPPAPSPPPHLTRPTAATPVAAPGKLPEKLVAFYIAEREGTDIMGSRIHGALQSQGLCFGERKIYHRLQGERPVFSVASLIKPGSLDPAEADGFSTPGLSVFMQLPGPVRPEAAFQDMLRTSRQLAQTLKAQLYDSEQRQLLTEERAHALQAQVEEWARKYAG
ncbi:MAG: hypothetical protein L0Y32_00075 [Nevskiales bacterium]|nr:hypothetical protein [Nevskiales bacterium]